MKKCNQCSVELIVGENWRLSMQKCKMYKCKSCYSKTQKKWKQNNLNKIKDYDKKWSKKRYNNLDSGVYAILKNNKIIYIGESKVCQDRIFKHFSKRKDLKIAKHISPISYALSIKELKREDLTFKILEYIDNDNERKKQERELIKQYKPKYNEKMFKV